MQNSDFQAEWIGARIRRDGDEVALDFTDFKGNRNVIRMATGVLKKMIGTLAQVLCSANNNARFSLPPEPSQADYEDAPGFVIAENIDLHLAEDGAAVLRVYTVSHKKWEVVLNPKQAERLSRTLLLSGAPKSVH